MYLICIEVKLVLEDEFPFKHMDTLSSCFGILEKFVVNLGGLEESNGEKKWANLSPGSLFKINENFVMVFEVIIGYLTECRVRTRTFLCRVDAHSGQRQQNGPHSIGFSSNFGSLVGRRDGRIEEGGFRNSTVPFGADGAKVSRSAGFTFKVPRINRTPSISCFLA